MFSQQWGSYPAKLGITIKPYAIGLSGHIYQNPFFEKSTDNPELFRLTCLRKVTVV